MSQHLSRLASVPRQRPLLRHIRRSHSRQSRCRHQPPRPRRSSTRQHLPQRRSWRAREAYRVVRARMGRSGLGVQDRRSFGGSFDCHLLENVEGSGAGTDGTADERVRVMRNSVLGAQFAGRRREESPRTNRLSLSLLRVEANNACTARKQLNRLPR